MNLVQQLAQTVQGRAMVARAAAATFMFKVRRGHSADAMRGVNHLAAGIDQAFDAQVRGEIARLIPRPFAQGWSAL